MMIDLLVGSWIINNDGRVLCNLFPNGVTWCKLSNFRVAPIIVILHLLSPWCDSCLKAHMWYGPPHPTVTAFHACAPFLMEVRFFHPPLRFMAVLCVAGLYVSKFQVIGFLCLLQDLVQFHLTYGWWAWRYWRVKLKASSHELKVFQCWPWFWCWSV